MHVFLSSGRTVTSASVAMQEQMKTVRNSFQTLNTEDKHRNQYKSHCVTYLHQGTE